MKKNMIALAVAAALVAPVAMADVTVSGGLQAELVQIGGNGSAANGLYAADAWENGSESSGNYGFLKFSANEDLGGGMKALAVYNLNANVGDTDRGGLSQRDAYVGLSTGLGTILAGSLSTPYKSSTVNYDPFLMTSFQARGSYGMSSLHNGYMSNAVAYANGFMGGMIKVVAALVLDEETKGDATTGAKQDQTNGKHAKSFSVNVAPMSGLDVAIAYIDASKMGSCTTKTTMTVDATSTSTTAPVTTTSTTKCAEGGKDANATKIGAKYNMGAFSVAAQVEMMNKGMTASGEKANITYLTGSFKVDDANTISAAVGRTDKKYFGGSDNGDYAAVGFTHAFSKNTSTTVGYRQSKLGSTKETAIGAGLRVNF